MDIIFLLTRPFIGKSLGCLIVFDVSRQCVEVSGQCPDVSRDVYMCLHIQAISRCVYTMTRCIFMYLDMSTQHLGMFRQCPDMP